MAFELQDHLQAGREADCRLPRAIASISRPPIPGSRSIGASAKTSRCRSVPSWPSAGIALRIRGRRRGFTRRRTRSSSATAARLGYDYLVIATGPELAFDEVPGLGPQGHTKSICHVDHADRGPRRPGRNSARDPGPVVVGAAQGASCFGPAYEFAMIMDTDLRQPQDPRQGADDLRHLRALYRPSRAGRRRRHQGAARSRRCASVTSNGSSTPRTTKVESRAACTSTEVNEDGKEKRDHELPFKFAMMLPAFRGIPAVARHRGPDQPARLHPRRQASAQCRNTRTSSPSASASPFRRSRRRRSPTGVPKTGFMIESMVDGDRAQYPSLARRQARRRTRRRGTPSAWPISATRALPSWRMPEIPPRNVNWSSQGKWVHTAKVAFEKYFLRKIRKGGQRAVLREIRTAPHGGREAREPAPAAITPLVLQSKELKPCPSTASSSPLPAASCC